MADIKNFKLEEVFTVLKKVGCTSDPEARWGIAIRLSKVRPNIDAIIESKKPTEDVREFMEKKRRVRETFGTPIPGSGLLRIDRGSYGEMEKAILDVELQNPDMIHKEREYETMLLGILNSVSSIDIDPIEYHWCGPDITGNDIAVLVEHGLIRKEKTEEVNPVEKKSIPNR